MWNWKVSGTYSTKTWWSNSPSLLNIKFPPLFSVLMTTLLCMVTQTPAFMNTYFLRTSWYRLISLICYWMDDVLCGLLLANGWVLTCPMSSRQLKMYFLASLDLILVSASCSSGDWKKEHKTASATERHTHVHTHRAQRHAHLPTKQMISYECVQEHVKSVYSAHLNTHAHFYLNSENIHNFLRCYVSMQGCCHVWPWLGEFTGALSSHFTLSRSTIFRDRSLIKLETHSTQCLV